MFAFRSRKSWKLLNFGRLFSLLVYYLAEAAPSLTFRKFMAGRSSNKKYLDLCAVYANKLDEPSPPCAAVKLGVIGALEKKIQSAARLVSKYMWLYNGWSAINCVIISLANASKTHIKFFGWATPNTCNQV